MLLFEAWEAFYNHRRKKAEQKKIFLLGLSLFQKYYCITLIERFFNWQIQALKTYPKPE